MIGLARQLSGLPAPSAPKPSESVYSSQASSKASSPQRSKQDEDFIAHEAEKIVRKGQHEERYARRGAFSEAPFEDRDGDSVYGGRSGYSSRGASPERGRQDPGNHRLSQISLASSVDSGDPGSLAPPQKRSSWPQPAKMTSSELAVANSHLLNRLKPFMANPLMNTPISAFFYNDSASRQHTVYTNASGHFTCRAALDFVPTHVRVLAGEKLSATEEVTITSSKGVSLISDIDDTIKHSAISSGAREIFRNAFIRDLGDLTIDGVREWYSTLHDMGVTVHYVSNSPWQLYPMLTTYFKLAHLPRGSFHLKQYSGMLQGIFEPVAERKKSSLEKILRDFPERKFILVGDSGEADLEVYTEIALDHPGKILGIFIRDVTTPVRTGYFDPSNGTRESGKHSRDHSRNMSADSLAMSKRISRPEDIREDDADLRAAIASSLADMEAETRQARKAINPDSPSPENMSRPDTPKTRPKLPPRCSSDRTLTQSPVVASPEEDLIDFTDEPPLNRPWFEPPQRNGTPTNGAMRLKPSPSPPPKPRALRSPSPGRPQPPPPADTSSKPPPPRPRKPSSAVKPPLPQEIQTWTTKPPGPQPTPTPAQHQPSPLSQVTQQSPVQKSRPRLPVRPQTSRSITQGLANVLPPVTALGHPRPPPISSSSYSTTPRAMSSSTTKSTDEFRPSSSSTIKAAPPPPPRRRNATNYTTTAANRKATNHSSGGWDDTSGGSLPGSPGEAGMGKKEFLWNQRWARAKSVLDRQSVTLRSWRVGSDVADVCVRLAEHALRDVERESKREQRC